MGHLDSVEVMSEPVDPRFQRGVSIPRFLAEEMIRELNQVNARWALLTIGFQYLCIAAAVVVCELYWNPVVYVLAVMFIGSRQHGLIIIGVHDGSHRRLFRSRRINDAISALIALPLGISISDYRAGHGRHHRFVATGRDPTADVTPTLPVPTRELVLDLLSWVSGWKALRFTAGELKVIDTAPKALAALGIVCLGLGLWFEIRVVEWIALYWLVPLVTWNGFVSRVRQLAEHYFVEPGHPLHRDNPIFRTRITEPTWLDRVLINPVGNSYHLTHHLCPGVPYYRLPHAHRLHMELPEYREQVHVTHGFHRVLWEMVVDGKKLG